MTNNTIQTIIVDDEDFERLEDGEVITYEYDHMTSVTLVAKRWKHVWENALRIDRPEERGEVIYLNDDDYRKIKYSHKGLWEENIVIGHESKEHLLFDEQSN